MRGRCKESPTKTMEVCNALIGVGEILNQPREIFETGKLGFEVVRCGNHL